MSRKNSKFPEKSKPEGGKLNLFQIFSMTFFILTHKTQNLPPFCARIILLLYWLLKKGNNF